MFDPIILTKDFERVADDVFQTKSVSVDQYDVTLLAKSFIILCENALVASAVLRKASDVGVEKATALVTVLNSVAAFSDKKAAEQFVSAVKEIIGEK